jgi:hypothetical protein
MTRTVLAVMRELMRVLGPDCRLDR